ncbi:MAG: hypothetical protein V4503_09180 [Gemmatimonadota bacterium]
MLRCIGLLAALTFVPAQLPAQAESDSLLFANATVQARVPSLGRRWVTGRVVRSTSALGCLAVMLPSDSLGGPTRFVFLRAADSLRVDQRTNTGAFALGLSPAEEADWVAFTRRQLAAINASCTGRRR